MLELRRVHVVADEEEFIEFDEELHRAQGESDDRRFLNKLLVGQESMKRIFLYKFCCSRTEAVCRLHLSFY